MSFRDRVHSLAPGAFRSAPAPVYINQAPLVMPSLDHPNPSSQPSLLSIRQNPLLMGPIWRIAFKLGSIPIKVYRLQRAVKGARPRQEASDHASYDLLRSPNEDLTRNLMMSYTIASMFANGKAAWLKERANPRGPSDPSNKVVAIWPVPTNILYVKKDPRRILPGFELRVPGEEPVPVSPRDMCYFRLMPDLENLSDGASPVGPLGAAGDLGGQGIEAMVRLFRSGILQRLWIDLHGADLEEDDLQRLRGEMELARIRPGGVPIMESGATLENMGDPVNADVLKGSVDNAEAVIRHMFGLPENYDDVQLFYSEVIAPVADAVEQELERSFFSEWPGEKLFGEFQFREILAGTPTQRADLHKTQVLSGQKMPSEVREDENDPFVEGSDVLLVPLNMIPLEDAKKNAEQPTPQKGSSGGFGGSEGKGTQPPPVGQDGKPALTVVAGSGRMRAAATRNWDLVRSRVLRGQGEAMANRLRGALNQESRELREHFGEPDTEGFLSIVARSDGEIERLMEGFMRQSAAAGWQAASSLVAPGEPPGVPSIDVEQAIAARVADMVSAFSTRRVDRFTEIREQQGGADAVREAWGSLSNHLVDVLGTTEATWAFEVAAVRSWGERGFADFVIVRRGDECRTGMCDDAEGRRYTSFDPPTPLHPSCRCFSVPSVLGE